MRVLKQATTANVMVLMVDSADHVTGKTGLTLTVTASKDGAGFATLDASATKAEVSSGWYKIGLTANDTSAIGDYVLHVTATGADPSDRILVIETATLTDIDTETDAINAKTANLPASPAAVGSAMTLTAAYNPAMTAATQASVSAIPTAPLLAVNYTSPPTAAAIVTALEASAKLLKTNGVQNNVVTTAGGKVDANATTTVDIAAIDTALTAAHGSGSWQTGSGGGSSGSYVLPVMTGEVYTATAVQRRTVTLVQGDTPTLTFSLGSDYTGWTPWFGAKGAAVLATRQAQWVDAAVGQGSVMLSAADTAIAGYYEAEVELRNAGQILTAIKFTLHLIPQVI